MKMIALLFALLLPSLAAAGVYEDMEEALISGDTPWAIQLINRGMDVNSVDALGNTLLMQTVQRSNMDFFDYLLKRRARINSRNRNGETALSLAAYKGKLPFVKRLVEAGADVNLYGWPPLIYASFNGHAAVVDYLLKKGAEVNATTANGSTALLFAARFGHLEVVELLLQNNADPNIANERGATAIDWALKTENTDIADLLRKAGGHPGNPEAIERSR
ncbi:MAG TPA: ankyrin repeat domain-containing protein [Accumulibacter sp.]|uniref:Ankyrin repeat protein n=2 Tax=Candidatus Accumulibacter TaxID=327159 RepID=A0A080M5S3_9PROT|nr:MULTISPECIES: ankyrin repeat domain-containing protein [Candidatus Accumulibacter]KFB76573.1 MAG: ankyrin repeat protein [Candidatus Accumulibacter cognatus]MBL8400092.1 ankyrin repeat domain-containing protein [Accumulibacter sp.]MBN8519448.1 ankyrin repeat domain-containing protein [Accumulibacter sp.]MBO3710926.1 ankyrin repeat domain-containing protein [Accumulibacter sp.]MCC2867460.1 ankyrin repeat domain-containing protein [Candidatus Accumulibacter phosphatis]